MVGRHGPSRRRNAKAGPIEEGGFFGAATSSDTSKARAEPGVNLLPACRDDYVDQDNPARVVRAVVDQRDLQETGFDGAAPAATGRPAYGPAVLLTKTLARVRTAMRLHVLA